MDYQNEDEIDLLSLIVNKIHPKNILEIGSMYGDSLQYWFALKPERLISIDMLVPTSDSRYGDQVEAHNLFVQWALDQGVSFWQFDDSHSPIVYQNVKQIMPVIDLLFIDGDHTYNGVKQDAELYIPLVRSGGVVAFHDIKPNSQYGDIEVPRYWNQIKNNYFWREISFEEDGLGIGVFIK